MIGDHGSRTRAVYSASEFLLSRLDKAALNYYSSAITNVAQPLPQLGRVGENGLLSDAIDEISRKQAEEQQRRRLMQARRESMRQLDRWLEQIEQMLEEDQRTVPETMVRDIATFLRGFDNKLHRALLRNRTREASRVLDVLFDAQESLLPRTADVA